MELKFYFIVIKINFMEINFLNKILISIIIKINNLSNFIQNLNNILY